MKARAVREVHIRSGSAERLSNNKKGVLYPGFEIEVVNTTKGELLEGRDDWYVDRNGDFYWSGGFFDDKKVDFKTSDILGFYNVADAWKAGIRGANVNVAVIDSGASHPAFAGHIDLPTSNAFRDITDLNGHGTHMAGLISSSTVDGISYAFAPESALTIYNHTVANVGSDQRIVKRALDACVARGQVHIVNVSYADPDPDIFAASVEGLIAANKIVVAAAGNVGGIGFPAKHPNVICVAAVNKNNEKLNAESIGPGLTACARGDEVDSLKKDSGITRLGAGSSQATAIVSGILALALSAHLKKYGHLPSAPLHRWAHELISKSCDPAGDENTFGYGMISLQKVLSNI